jgi:hypothetical protein
MGRIHPAETAMSVRTTLAPLALLALLSACAPTTPEAPRSSHSPASAACLDPSRARSFAVLDDDTLIVDAGVDHYRLRLEPTCVGIDFEVALRFRGDPVTGRVCGNARDAILTDRGDCRIDRVEWIPREEYDALEHPKRAAPPPKQ